MKTILAFISLILATCNLSSQILKNDVEQKNSLAIKVGWDQTFATGINYTRGLNTLFNTNSVNLQFEFLSPFATFYKLNNGRISSGLQIELYKKEHFELFTNFFGTYSWTKDVSAEIKGVGIYTSILPVFRTGSNWLLGAEFAFRPTLFSQFRFSESTNDTFQDRYPLTRGTMEYTGQDGWYSITNNKFQVGLIINKKIASNYQLGAKLGLEHYVNDHKVLLNGWIGQIPIVVHANFAYSF